MFIIRIQIVDFVNQVCFCQVILTKLFFMSLDFLL